MSDKLKTKVKKSRPIACTVISDKMNKSRVAMVEHLVKHPTYKKYIHQTSKLMFHDEENASKIGDKVLVVSSRPLSARKRFKLDKIVGHTKQKALQQELGE